MMMSQTYILQICQSVSDGQTHLEDASRIKNDMHITAGQMKIIN